MRGLPDDCQFACGYHLFNPAGNPCITDAELVLSQNAANDGGFIECVGLGVNLLADEAVIKVGGYAVKLPVEGRAQRCVFALQARPILCAEAEQSRESLFGRGRIASPFAG